MLKTIWLSYDLCPIIDKADYKGLYTFLDSFDAKECGANLACFKIEVNDESEIEETIKQKLREYMKIHPRDRIYIIYTKMVDGEKKVVGKFLFGKRKPNPVWNGYALMNEDDVDED